MATKLPLGRITALLLTAVALAACAGTASPKPVSDVSFAPASPSPSPASVELRADALTRAQAFARAAAAGAPVAEYLEGPGLVVALGGKVVQLRTDPDGRLPGVELEWSGCAPYCQEWTTSLLFRSVARDLSSSTATVSTDRISGPDAGERDPRGEALSALPTVVSYHSQNGKWRTWYVVFDSTGTRIVALAAELGSLA